MSKKNPSEFDRQEWLDRLRQRTTKEKVVTITLRPNGVKMQELQSLLGSNFACQLLENGQVRIAVKQAPQEKVSAQ